MAERFLGALPPLPVQRVAPSAGAESGKDHGGAKRVSLDQEESEKTTLRMIISTLTTAENSVGTPKELPLHLLFLRMLFTRLRESECCPLEEDPTMERLPVEAFRRVFERLLFLLSDPRGFDDSDTYIHGCDGLVAWEEFFQVHKQRDLCIRLSLWERVFLTLESPDPAEAPLLARTASNVVLGAVALSSCVTVLATLPELRGWSGRPQGTVAQLMQHVDEACLGLFCVEYGARLMTCWAVRSELFDRACLLELLLSHDPIQPPSALRRLFRFVFAPSNLVDLAAILPGVVAWFVETDGNGLVVLRLVRLTRIFHVLKNPALVEPVVVLARTMEQSTMALYFLLFNLMLGIMIFGSLMYLVEGQGIWDTQAQLYVRKVGRQWNSTAGAWDDVLEPSPFQSIPHTFWWAIVTAATVGYGDHYPTTSLGYGVAALTMAFSLVITALPVGLIGATFERAWEEFALEKKAHEQASKRHIGVVASAIQRLDPARIRKLMLLEVWHDRGLRSGPALGPRANRWDFMGEAKVRLELPADAPVSKRLTVPLEANNDICERDISGSVTLAYAWTPHTLDVRVDGGGPSTSSDQEGARQTSRGNDAELRGKLEVSIIAADHLVNLDCGKHHQGGASSPFFMVFVYPTCPDSNGAVEPCVWRTGTAAHTLSPRWYASHSFEYNWSEPRQVVRRWSRSCDDRIRAKGVLWAASAPQLWATAAAQRPGRGNAAAQQPGGCVDEVVALIRQMSLDLQLLREELRELSGRVDRLLGKVQGWPDVSAEPLKPIKDGEPNLTLMDSEW